MYHVDLDDSGDFRFIDDAGRPVFPHGKNLNELQDMLIDLLSVVADADAFGGEPRGTCWKSARANHLSVHPSCAACGTRRSLAVHHIEPFHLYPERECDLSNLITFCPICHLIFGHLKSWQSHNPQVISDAEGFLEKVRRRP
jgi:5-methylcytosine-specific restriction protein A